MILLEWILTISIILSAIVGVLFILLQGSQSARGLFEESSQNLFASTKSNWVNRFTAAMIAIFLLSCLGFTYLQTLSNKSLKIKQPSFIKPETLTTETIKPGQVESQETEEKTDQK